MNAVLDMVNWDGIKAQAQAMETTLLGWLSSPQFYAQVIAIVVAVVVARIASKQLLAKFWLLNAEPVDGKLLRYRRLLYSCRDLLQPALIFVGLAGAVAVCDAAVGSSWLVRLAQSAAVISLLYALINRFLSHPVINAAARWIGIPVVTIYVFGYMGQLVNSLDGLAFAAGNIRISALTIIKACLFGGLLFWAGRISSSAGQKAIREQQSIDIQTRELAAKALELLVFAVVGLLLMNILGLDLTALAVFSGALGVGLGFGLQQIASNFISGIIILLERSLKVGDFIELEDGRSGTLRDIKMRSSTLETFDGKDIMVPNERFITTRFVNWTHRDPRQRYEVQFVVSFDADVTKVQSIVQPALAACLGVLQEPSKPECKIKAIGDNGFLFTAQFWADGLDEGDNSFTHDALMAIILALKANKIDLARPQRLIWSPEAKKSPERKSSEQKQPETQTETEE
jgi:small-conductance mechanosensitive channel